MIMMMMMMMTMMTYTIPYRRTKTHIWDKALMGFWVHPIFIITIIIISLCFKGFQRCCGFASSSSSKSPQSLFQEFANSNERRLAFSKRKQFLVTKERKKVEGVIAIRDPSVSLWPPWLPTIQRFFIQFNYLFESIFLGPGIMRVMSD